MTWQLRRKPEKNYACTVEHVNSKISIRSPSLCSSTVRNIFLSTFGKKETQETKHDWKDINNVWPVSLIWKCNLLYNSKNLRKEEYLKLVVDIFEDQSNIYPREPLVMCQKGVGGIVQAKILENQQAQTSRTIWPHGTLEENPPAVKTMTYQGPATFQSPHCKHHFTRNLQSCQSVSIGGRREMVRKAPRRHNPPRRIINVALLGDSDWHDRDMETRSPCFYFRWEKT